MKILFFGNMCNYAYWFARWSRELGYDAYALIESDETIFTPEKEDPEYDPAAPPHWVRFYRPGTESDAAWRGYADDLLPQLLREFDSVHTFSPTAAIAAAALERPFIHHNVGSFGRSASWIRFQSLRSALSGRYFPLRWRFRRAMARSRGIVVSVGMDHFEVYHSPFRDKVRCLPIPYDALDAGRFCGREAAPALTTFLMPARQNWYHKGQDLVFPAIAGLSPEEKERCRFVVMEWGVDVQRSRDLVDRLGLGGVVTWSPLLPRMELWRKIAEPGTVVVVEFCRASHGGGYGGVARDAMAIGVPIITHARPEVNLMIHRSAAPVFHAECSVESIREQIRRCLALPSSELQANGATLKRWLHEECQYQKVIPRYIELHEELCGRR